MTQQGDKGAGQLDSLTTTNLDEKFSKTILIGKNKSYSGMTEQKSKDIEDIKRDLARKNDALTKQYMAGVYEKPVTLSDDRLTQHLVESISENLDAKQIERISNGMNPKIAQMMVDTVIRRGKNERFARKHGPILSALVRGKLGIDLFLIIFAVTGLVGIPTYFLFKQKRVKDFMRRTGISPISVEDLDQAENRGIDIDDISKHVNYYDLTEDRRRIIAKRKIEHETKELEEELYGAAQRAKDEYLFGEGSHQTRSRASDDNRAGHHSQPRAASPIRPNELADDISKKLFGSR